MKTRQILHGFFIFCFILCGRADAQVISKDVLVKYKSWPRFNEIAAFYSLNKGQLVWVKDTLRQKELRAVIRLASSVGLDEGDYQNKISNPVLLDNSLQTADDSIAADVHYTDAAIHFFADVKNGSSPPAFGYTGLNYSPDVSSVLTRLLQHLQRNNLYELLVQLQPRSKEYGQALDKLRWFQKVISEQGFAERKIVSAVVDSANKPLLARLYHLGFLDSPGSNLSKKELLTKVKLAQQEFDLLNDGVLRSTSLQAFNISLYQRVEEIKSALNTLRWLEGIKQQSLVLVLNIPAANLFVYDGGQIVLDSRVIVGKRSTPTPSLTSTITEVILYPYWTVPHKIATRELLPLIKKSSAFLQLGNYQVLNKAGKVLNPSSINWHALSSTYFPYIIRQSTGCDNALGLVKFNFYNPFTVYLHDTPNKILFSSSRRFYSHGCMRVEKPEELAHYLLGSNRVAFDTLTAKGCIYHQSPVIVPPQKKLPVIILYSTVWYTAEGRLRFYNDVYDKLNFPAKRTVVYKH